MRAVVDTNVLVSGLLWFGAPRALIEVVRDGGLTLVTSPVLIIELKEVLKRPRFRDVLARSGTDADGVMTAIGQLAVILDPPPLPVAVSRDPDDDAVLATAVAAQVDVIISGDRDLLTLGSHEGIPIVSPAAALEKLRE